MASRLERWKKYRRKALKRRKKFYEHCNDSPATFFLDGSLNHAPRWKYHYKDTRPLLPLSHYLVHPRPGPNGIFLIPPIAFDYFHKGGKKPPYVKWHSPPPASAHFHLERIGLHKRTVTHRGWTTNRANNVGRMIFGANLFYNDWGFWPHWDPSLRTPFMEDPDGFTPRSPYGVMLDNQR